jgi:hypothetical protein
LKNVMISIPDAGLVVLGKGVKIRSVMILGVWVFD